MSNLFQSEQEANEYKAKRQLHGRVAMPIEGTGKWGLNFPLETHITVVDSAGMVVNGGDGLEPALKNVSGDIAAPPFYVWANEDCANKSESFKEAKAIRLQLINEGSEGVYIVDAFGVEVVDAEVLAHEALMNAGYFAGARRPEVKPDFPGAFMVNDPQDPDGFSIVGDDIEALILEARDHLIDPGQARLNRSEVAPQKETPLSAIAARIAEALPAATGYEKGYRDALESMALALGPKLASTLDEAITTALDAYANNAEETDAVTLNLNVFDDVGNLVDGTTATLSAGQLSDIVDHASQLILIRRDGQSLDNVLNELDEALSVADVIAAAAESAASPERPR